MDGVPQKGVEETVAESKGAVAARCPYCGQPLAGGAAAHLARAERAQSRKLAVLAKEEAARRFSAQVAAVEKRHAATLAALEKKQASEQAKQVRELERMKRKLRSEIEGDYAARNRQLDVIAANLQRKNAELQHQVDRLSRQEQGKLREEDLFLQLKAEFPRDAITRLGRGVAGVDVLQEVHCTSSESDIAGVIAYECKSTQTWSTGWLDKLRQDGATHGARCLVLMTDTFPKGKDGTLFIADGIIVVRSTHAVIVIAKLLRSHLEELYRTQLAGTERDRKTTALLTYVSSQEFHNQLNEVLATTNDLQSLLQKEQIEHKKLWVKRELLYEAVAGRVAEIEEELRTIVESRAVPRAKRTRRRVTA